MSKSTSGNGTHDTTVNTAETVRQAAVVPTASKATVVAAETTFFQTTARSAITNGLSPSVFLQALRSQGKDLWS